MPVFLTSCGHITAVEHSRVGDDDVVVETVVHDAWAVWGHSGSPLFNSDGKLVGLHSGWDETSGNKRGIGLRTLHAFLSDVMH